MYESWEFKAFESVHVFNHESAFVVFIILLKTHGVTCNQHVIDASGFFLRVNISRLQLLKVFIYLFFLVREALIISILT